MHMLICPAGWSIELNWLLSKTGNKSSKRRLLKISVAETIYVIWRCRNLCVFQQIAPGTHVWQTVLHNIRCRIANVPNLVIYCSRL